MIIAATLLGLGIGLVLGLIIGEDCGCKLREREAVMHGHGKYQPDADNGPKFMWRVTEPPHPVKGQEEG